MEYNLFIPRARDPVDITWANRDVRDQFRSQTPVYLPPDQLLPALAPPDYSYIPHSYEMYPRNDIDIRSAERFLDPQSQPKFYPALDILHSDRKRMRFFDEYDEWRVNKRISDKLNVPNRPPRYHAFKYGYPDPKLVAAYNSVVPPGMPTVPPF